MLKFLKSILSWKRYKHFLVRNPGYMSQPSIGCAIENQWRLGMPEDFVQSYYEKHWSEDE